VSELEELLLSTAPGIHVRPQVSVWVKLAEVLNEGRRGVPVHEPSGGLQVGQEVPGKLLAWVRTDWRGWVAIVDVALRFEGGQQVWCRMLVPHSAITKDSVMYRRKLEGKTSNRPTLRQR
jgi:hypothetical protein